MLLIDTGASPPPLPSSHPAAPAGSIDSELSTSSSACGSAGCAHILVKNSLPANDSLLATRQESFAAASAAVTAAEIIRKGSGRNDKK